MRPTPDQVREIFDYNPETGEFRWRIKSRGKVAGGGRGIQPGDPAGSKCSGKLGGWRLKALGAEYPAGVVAFVIVKGRWPVGDVDHEDRDRMNNRWKNLREGMRSQNQANRGNFPHSSPHKGVGYDKQTGKWRARIRVSGKLIDLGRFADLEVAHSVYLEAARRHFGEFARG